jgi:hypothetical protein
LVRATCFRRVGDKAALSESGHRRSSGDRLSERLRDWDRNDVEPADAFEVVRVGREQRHLIGVAVAAIIASKARVPLPSGALKGGCHLAEGARGACVEWKRVEVSFSLL